MEELKHECGVAMIRLLKPVDYYLGKYGTGYYALNKMYLMMEKQHNRGQEGAGIACVNMEAPVGEEYMFRERAEGKDAITEIFNTIHNSQLTDHGWKEASLFMGHLRYSTTGKRGLTFVHPFLRRNNWRAKNLCLCGNFNMTNIDEVFRFLTAQGQSPRIHGDSYITLELMGHRLDREVERLYAEAKANGLEGIEITRYIDDNVNVANVLHKTMSHYDGGYVMCGLTGSGEMFAVRDPWGIRTAFYYRDDEVVAFASERPVLQTTFDLSSDDICELKPGEALVVRRNGDSRLEQIMPTKQLSACSFERIYFSRGSDSDIYQERKRLGKQLTPAIMNAIDGDVDHTVFSYIPNTAEVAYYGMTDGFRQQGYNVRTEKVVWKDIKLRTFISANTERNDLAAHVYDISYGSIRPYEDNLVVIDDSIVRGTTLKESIFKILDRLHPRKIVMVSSSPQIRYPDYYGIDMASLEELCAFRATMALIDERNMWSLVEKTYKVCKESPPREMKDELTSPVRAIYEPFTVDEINKKIGQMLRPKGMQSPIELVFQSIDGLHEACPNHRGDWYFTGHYPTPGGIRMVNQAFVNYVESLEK
ncbi:MAG: amidophosphoribosyltransferase [Bacteroidaceae bacterium]|nr:amidophosphoribosyltransferase [Bacteroidaceae bacterium]